MAAGLARSDLHTSYRAGSGRLREHTLAFGEHVVAIESIATLTLVERRRSWWLGLLGLLIAAAAAYAVSIYGPLAWAGVILGAGAIVVNLLAPVDCYLSIGTSDGHITSINSTNSLFVRRLLDLLTEKVNSRNHTLLASFDISSGQLQIASPPTSIAENHAARGAAIRSNAESEMGMNDPIPAGPAPAGESLVQPLSSASELDDALFSGDAEPAFEPGAPVDERHAAPRMQAVVSQVAPHDPLLDGPSVTRPRRQNEPDWMTTPAGATQNFQPKRRSGAGGWLLAVLVLTIGAAGTVTAWLIQKQPGGIPIVSLMTPPPVTDASFRASAASTPAPAASVDRALPATVAASDPAPTEEPPGATASPPIDPAFTSSAPRVLEPAEGVHLAGGPQLVRLAWSPLADAKTHVVEVEAFNEAMQSWTDAWGPGRVVVDSGEEIAETIPATGQWRWRVRAVAATGEQSLFSQWSRFSISE